MTQKLQDEKGLGMKPIKFNTEMVQAILEGRKTQTRRVVKPLYNKDYSRKARMSIFSDIKKINNAWAGVAFDGMPFINDDIAQPKYQVGDILWVRETWQYAYDLDEYDQWIEGTGRYVYRADDANPFNCWIDGETGELKDTMPWRPSIHMPFEAARIFLKVTGVGVERLQEITEENAKAEGCINFKDKVSDGKFDNVTAFDLTARDAFRELWDSIYLKRGYGWNTNPWVWVYEFERVDKPEGM